MSESGQASVEWIGLVLLLTLGLAAVVRFAPHADADALGPELLHAIGCAARGGCTPPPRGPAETRDAPRGMVSAPPLVPVAPAERPGSVPRSRAVPPLLRRAGPRVGLLWRRSWIFCLGYERARYGVLHPEIRFPHVPIPLSENLRMANDCLSPVDLVRDWELIRGPR